MSDQGRFLRAVHGGRLRHGFRPAIVSSPSSLLLPVHLTIMALVGAVQTLRGVAIPCGKNIDSCMIRALGFLRSVDDACRGTRYFVNGNNRAHAPSCPSCGAQNCTYGGACHGLRRLGGDG